MTSQPFSLQGEKSRSNPTRSAIQRTPSRSLMVSERTPSLPTIFTDRSVHRVCIQTSSPRDPKSIPDRSLHLPFAQTTTCGTSMLNRVSSVGVGLSDFLKGEKTQCDVCVCACICSLCSGAVVLFPASSLESKKAKQQHGTLWHHQF